MKAKSRILIVDDEKPLAESLRLYFQSKGFEAATAYDGETGLEKTILYKPHLVILDLIMPEMGGWELCRGIRNNPLTAHLPLLVITASKLPDVAERAKGLGIDVILQKPFQLDDLLKSVERLLQTPLALST